MGKTTAINHLLRQRPKDEQWAVLVNEYGLVGVDAALMESSAKASGPARVALREVVGGCICCSAAFMFDMSLVVLLQRRPDRLLIEPTGLASVSGILETLNRKGIRENVDVRPVLCLLDPRLRVEAMEREEVRDQVERADVLLAGRSDLATEGELAAFYNWAAVLHPQKTHVGASEGGRVDVGLLDLVTNTDRGKAPQGNPLSTPAKHHEANRHDEVPEDQELAKCDASQPILTRSHHSDAASTVGWVVWSELDFDAERVVRWLGDVARRSGTRRVKGVVRTNQGWMALNFSDGITEARKDVPREDSRLELVIESDGPPEVELLTEELRTCLTRSSSAWCDPS